METDSSELSINRYLKEIETNDITSIVDEGLNVVLRPLFFSLPEANDILQQLIAEIIDHGPEKGGLSTYNKERRDIKRKQVSYGDKDVLHSFCGNTMEVNTWTPTLSKIRFRIEKCLGIRYNFCVVNWRNDGHVRMGSHIDIEDGLETDVPVIRISFGPARKFLFVHRYFHDPKVKTYLGEPKFWVYKSTLPPGSLVELKGRTDGFWYVDLPAHADAKENTRVSITFLMMRSSRNVHIKDASNVEYSIKTLDYDLVPMSTTLSLSSGSKTSQERGRIQELQAKRAEQEQGSSQSGVEQRERRLSREKNKINVAYRKKQLSRAQSVPLTMLSSKIKRMRHSTRRPCSEQRASTISVSSVLTSELTTRSTEESYEAAFNLLF
jgi:alkylated DNA repair dioxygenase AlkB